MLVLVPGAGGAKAMSTSDNPLPEAIRRLQAYAEAGADVLYAPGISTREQISAVVAAAGSAGAASVATGTIGDAPRSTADGVGLGASGGARTNSSDRRPRP